MKKIIYILLLLVGTPAVLISQNLSNAQRRQMMMDLLELIEDYEFYSQLSDGKDEEFIKLFQNENVAIYNDLLGLSVAETLPVKDYVAILKEKADFSEIEMKNIICKEIYLSNNKWLARISFDKKVKLIDKCDITFDSKEYYQADHKVEFVASWDSVNRECKIVSLTGYINSDAEKLPENYMVFKQSHPNDSLLLCNGKNIHFDSWNQAFLARNAEFTYPADQDMKLFLIDDTLGCNIVTMEYRPTRWRLKPHVDFQMGDAFNIETVNDNAIQTSSSSFGWGVDVGYVYPTEKKLKWGLFFGLGFQKSELSLSIPTMAYAYYAGPQADVDGDKYIRHYSMKDTKYSTELKEIYIPFYVDMDYRINNYLSVYADAGLKIYAGYAEEKVHFETTYSTYGKYPQYGNLIIDHQTYGGETAINGFVSNAHITRENVSDEILSDYSLDGFVGLGVRGRVYKDWYVDLGMYYQTNLFNNYTNKGDVLVTNHTELTTTNKVPMSYLNYQGERIENITSYISSMRRSAFSLNVGVMWKF